jgi:pyrroloquinoline quinone biosynthesis protein D
MVQLNTPLKLSRKFRLQWEESQQKYVLLYAEGMVQLNESAAEILQLCDGKRSTQEIIDALQSKFHDNNLPAEVITFLEDAMHKGWVTYVELPH